MSLAAPTLMHLPAWFLGLTVLTHAATAQTFSSGENRTHLIELFSSEGCSSCPPAEEWLGGLRASPALWRDFVPVAFHVVYWDRLGWRDRFASKEFTNRQYAYSAAWHSDNVYTPEFVVDGSEWRHSSVINPVIPSAESAGVLSAAWTADGMCRVAFSRSGKYEVHLALLGGNISSKVGAGENGGRTLHHEFVALHLESAPVDGGTAELKLARPEVTGISRYALAVWITRRGELAPVQATGGWLE